MRYNHFLLRIIEIMTYLILIAGLAMLLFGADKLVDASVAIAKRAQLSDFVIGVTIVGMGTSAPELFVSLSSAISGHGDLALGNVMGSNICNTLLILGVTAVILPFGITHSNLRRDIPFSIILSFLLMLLCCDSIFPHIDEDEIGRLDGFFLLLVFLCYIGYTFLASKQNAAPEPEQPADKPEKTFFTGRPMWVLVPGAIVSLAVLLTGGNLFLDSAVEIAKELGMSEKTISITIVALGTSLPELITCIIAARKGNPQLALGNVLGSNVFNVMLILGISAMISPIVLKDINMIDFGVLILSSVLTFIFAFTLRRNVIDRAEGALLLILYAAYTGWLLWG